MLFCLTKLASCFFTFGPEVFIGHYRTFIFDQNSFWTKNIIQQFKALGKSVFFCVWHRVHSTQNQRSLIFIVGSVLSYDLNLFRRLRCKRYHRYLPMFNNRLILTNLGNTSSMEVIRSYSIFYHTRNGWHITLFTLYLSSFRCYLF